MPHIPFIAWLWGGGLASLAVLIYALVTIIKHHLLANRLELLAKDILSFGRSTLTKHLQRCEFCHNTTHVHVWEYGNEHSTKEVLICYLCASRIAKLLDPPTLPKKGAIAHDRQPRRGERLIDRSRSRQTFAR